MTTAASTYDPVFVDKLWARLCGGRSSLPGLPQVVEALREPGFTTEQFLGVLTRIADAAIATEDEGLLWLAIANMDRLGTELAFEGHLLKNRLFTAFHHPGLALQAARHAFELRPNDAVARAALLAVHDVSDSAGVVLLAEAAFERGDGQVAADLFLDVVRLDPKNVEAWTGLGVILYSGGSKEQSLSMFTRVLAIQPNHKVALLNRFRVSVELGRAKEALATGRALLATHPGTPEAAEIQGVFDRSGVR